MRTDAFKWILSVLLLLLTAASSLGGQQSEVPDSVHHRNNCRLAGQVITTGRPAAHTTWALSYIGACGDTEYNEGAPLPADYYDRI